MADPLNLSQPFVDLTNKSIIEGTTLVYTQVMGLWLWVVLLAALVILVYLRSENMGLTFMVLMLTTTFSLVWLVPPAYTSWFWAAGVLALTITFWRLIKKN